jgi:hypothetical protein
VSSLRPRAKALDLLRRINRRASADHQPRTEAAALRPRPAGPNVETPPIDIVLPANRWTTPAAGLK